MWLGLRGLGSIRFRGLVMLSMKFEICAKIIAREERFIEMRTWTRVGYSQLH